MNVQPIRAPYFPACFEDAKQYQDWRASAAKCDPGQSTYCADCTPQYQAEMILQKRCGHPGTTFHIDAEGEIEGVRPGFDLRRRKKVA